MATIRTDDRGRAMAIAGVVAVHAALGLALLHGLGVALPQSVSDRLTVLNVLPPPPPPPHAVERQHRITPRKEGAAAPPNLRSKPTEVVAPKPILPPPVPQPIPAAPIAGSGSAPSAGAAPFRGPGTGSGGIGTGTGSGGSGYGDGGGGGTPLRLKSGRLKDSDYPREAWAAHASGTVGLHWIVGVDGRVHDCSVTRSSGNAALDETTCRLITARFRYVPTKDAAGRPVPDEVDGEHVWTLERRDGEADDAG